MTNAETVDLCEKLGVPVKSHSSSLQEAYADMVRRRAERDGLVRDEQPEEPKTEKKPAKKAAAKKSTAKKSTAKEAETPPAEVDEPAPEAAPEPAPETAPEPAPEPTPEPEPVVAAEPTPEPAPEPDVAAEPEPTPEPAAPSVASEHALDGEPEPDLRVGPTSTSLTADELAAQAGVSPQVVHDLESFGMIESRRVGAESYFEPSARVVVDACRSFLEHGIEVRHLRMYKIAAEREAGVFEQLVMPLLKQRNPEARSRASEMVTELADVGERLHAALLRKALSDTMP